MGPDEKTRLRDDATDTPASPSPDWPGQTDALVGRLLKGAYRIEAKIGEGGMGVVYRATHLALRMPVAVKTVHVEHRIPSRGVERFFREARLLSQLNHPNIVHFIDFGVEAGPLHFLVMEYLQGEPLDAFVEKHQRLPRELIGPFMNQICGAMTAAHQNHVIHRDLKPSNIHVVHEAGGVRPTIKLLDFGLAKMLSTEPATVPAGLTREGAMMGTCGYSAPEQLHGVLVDERADIYSLGALLYFVLAGRPPYFDEGFRTTLVKQLTSPPDPLVASQLTLPEMRAVEGIIHKAMSVRPEDRFQTPAALLEALGQVFQQDTPGKHSASARTVLHTPEPMLEGKPVPAVSSRPRWGWVAGLTTLVAFLAGFMLLAHPPRQTDNNPPELVPGVTAAEVILGMTGPFSGPTRELGRDMQIGIATCFHRVNDTGGVFGRRLRLVALDDRYEPDRACENMKQLLHERNVFAFIGNVGTPTAEATLPIALEHDRLFFGACSGASILRKDPPDRYVFNYRAGYAEETAAIVKYLVGVKQIAPSQIAVFAQRDTYGSSGLAGVQQALARMGKSPAKILCVGYDRNHNNVEAAVAAVVQAREKIRAVIIVATYQPAALFIHKVKAAGLDLIFANVSFVGSGPLRESLSELGMESFDGVVVTQVVPHFASPDVGVRNYRQHLGTYYPEEAPGFASLEGYIAASILVEGLRNAGKQLTTAALIAGLEKIHNLDLGIGAPITFDPREHQGLHKVWAAELDARGDYRDLNLE